MLEDIGMQAAGLLAKGRAARFLDKRKDSGEVAALVEKLRQAILDYQVSIRDYWNWRSLTCIADVTATIGIQPSRPIDGESLFDPSYSTSGLRWWLRLLWTYF